MSPWLRDAYEPVEWFLYTGGDVLVVLLGVTLVLWYCIIERLWFFLRMSHRLKTGHRSQELKHHSTNEALWLRALWLSEARLNASHNLLLIRGLIAVCPLLGLLGTVTGMIEVFQTLAITGSNSARALSSGITHATLPTLAGLVIALSGYYFVTYFDSRMRRELRTRRKQLLLPASVHS